LKIKKKKIEEVIVDSSLRRSLRVKKAEGLQD